MLPDAEKYKFKDKGPQKDSIKKMILLAQDYVDYLRLYRKNFSNAEAITKVLESKDAPDSSKLLPALRDDLRCATDTFLEEFVAADGVVCLLETLRACQSRQNTNAKVVRGRQEQTLLRKISNHQHDCLLCLKYTMKNPKCITRLTEDAHGLSSIASCLMSTYPKSRVIALELLSGVLESRSHESCHGLILEALTAMRVVFGEPVRFKFLVGLLQGNIASPPDFQRAGLRFVNGLLRISPRPADRIRLQCELEEAGLDVDALETDLRCRNVKSSDGVWVEIDYWRNSYVDANGKRVLETENQRLQKEVQLLRQALQKLEEDKINLMHIEMELKEKCEDLNEEVTTLKTEMKIPKMLTDSGPRMEPKILDDDDAFNSADSGQLETEEIFIDVPTIRPPEGFRSETDQSATWGRTCFQGSSGSDKDSALSESESDSGLNWSYPDIPETPANGERRPAAIHRGEAEVFFHYPGRDKTSSCKKPVQSRSRSEDRRESGKGGETKVAGSAGFFMVRRPDPVTRQTSLPVRDPISVHPAGRPQPSYQLPVAYRSNFLTRGHSNCDLYSGDRLDKTPTVLHPDYGRGVSVATSGGTISALVHREITKAVRQISGWI